MKKLLSILVLCLGCFGFLEAQDIWKPINGTGILGAGPDGSIFAYGEYGTLSRSQDDGETWQIVLGQETGFTGHINSSCFAVSPEGRICVFNDNQQTVVYSDDNGDTWQQTPSISSCAMPDKTGLCVPTNDIIVVWAENGEISYSLDGGETWEGWIPDFMYADNGPAISDLLVNENGDVYLGLTTLGGDGGISHSTLSDIQNWEFVAAGGVNIKDMAFDPEGNVVACGYNVDGSSAGFQHAPGFYLFDGTTLAISDGGIVYRPHFDGNQAVLSYSTDHGEHFTDIGEHVPLVDIAPGGDAYFLIKGNDNHLYFDGGGEYWKCIPDADEIIGDSPTPYHPIVEDGKQWNVLFSYPWSPPEPQHKYTDIYKIEGDTLVDGVSYKVMYTTRNEDLTDWSFCGVIRETENKQVFYRGYGSADERMLYDFSMQVGDTIFMYEEYMVVIETGEALVGDEPRQQIVLEYPFGGTETWIEGMGSLYGIVDSGSQFLVGGSTDLLCYYEDGDLVWQNTTPGYDECYIVNTGQQGSFVVAPSTLTFEEQGVPQTFTIYNQTDNAVTISSIDVQPDDNMVLLSYGELPRTLQPNETMNVEVEVNAVGNKGYNTYRVNVATSIGNRQVTVRVKDDINLYYPLVHEGNDRQKWNVVYILANDNYPNDYHTEIQSIRDNINLDGVDYKLVWTESVYESKKIAGAVREEDKRVYFRRYWGQSYEDEVLLYDFNLTVGDTVTVGWADYQLIVLEESEIEVNGTMRRQLGLAEYFAGSTNYEVEEYWIEGVGSTYGFLNSGYEGWVGAFVHLLCYHENGNLVWDNEAFDECVMNSDGAPATFAPQGAEWYFHVLSQGPITQPSFYYLKSVVTGTEEVQGHLCSVIDGYRYVYEEDDVVYMYNHTTDSFTVMYDFNAEEGDTWYCDIEEGFTGLVTVDSVGSVTWNGHTYRTQYVTGYIPDEGFLIYDGRIIEGIGYEKGLFPHEYVFDGTEYEYMRCYLEDGELLYHEGDYACDYEPNSGNACWDGSVAEAYEGGDGTAENPYQIKTSEQLALLAQQTNDGTGGNAYYEMTANINLKDCLTGGGRPWVSIGTREHPFTGHFNGGGKNIMNLFQNFNDGDTQSIGGLFGYASNATLENVTVSNSTIEGVNFAGLIVGWAVNTNIMNCSVGGSISYSYNASCSIGGVAGMVDVDYSTDFFIRNCINNATIQANIVGSSGNNVYYFGGIVGQSYVDDYWSNGNLYIVDCCNHGDLIGRGDVGGIAGSHDGIVENCDNFGQISSSGTSGGIVGYTEGMVKNCHNHSSGTVTGNCTGGIVGYSLGGWTLSCVNNAPVIGQFKHSSPSASNRAGGIIGHGDHIFNCYNTGDVAFTLGDNMDEDAIYVGGIGGNIDECKNSYNIGAVASSELQYARCGIIAGYFYDTKNVYWHGDYDLPVYGIGEDPAGSCAFRSGATATSWVLDEAQYGTVDLVEALNAGASEIESQYSGLGFMSRWDYDTEMANNGFPVLGDAIEEFVFNGSEWYYEIENEDGSITYQYLESSADTTVNNQTVTIIIRTNTLYDKAGHTEVTLEYIYEENDVVYWWNKDLQEFTVLYDLGAEVGDEWEIKVGTESLVMHVDAVESVEYEGRTFKTLQVSDAEELFSGTIVCGIGHLTSFFPERLMNRGKGYRVEGIRCYWREGELVFKNGDKDCDEVYKEYHNGIEEDGPSTGSGTLTVYPNPTNGVLYVETRRATSLQTETYRITNLMGQTVLMGSLNADTQRIDVSALPQGMYFITISDTTMKFVVR